MLRKVYFKSLTIMSPITSTPKQLRSLNRLINWKHISNTLKLRLQKQQKIHTFNLTWDTDHCDASRFWLGAALEKRLTTGWHTVAFTSRFLKSNEEIYVVNELEFLGAVWLIAIFIYYVNAGEWYPLVSKKFGRTCHEFFWTRPWKVNPVLILTGVWM